MFATFMVFARSFSIAWWFIDKNIWAPKYKMGQTKASRGF